MVANDVAALDAMFWNNPNTLRFGIAENLYGYEAIASFRSSRPAIDLTRHLKNTVIVTYGRDFATANTEFQRIGSSVTGRQSHVWVRTADGWRIAAAHVSLMPASSRVEAPRALPAMRQLLRPVRHRVHQCQASSFDAGDFMLGRKRRQRSVSP